MPVSANGLDISLDFTMFLIIIRLGLDIKEYLAMNNKNKIITISKNGESIHQGHLINNNICYSNYGWLSTV